MSDANLKFAYADPDAPEIWLDRDTVLDIIRGDSDDD